ncbi:MAG: hypothetical protein Q4F06_03625 [Eubacteriales bacterium]|nr:hypothetical protein [Eubacteriales bacterium]
MAKTIPITEFDNLTLPEYIQIIKAVIPFMEYEMQRTFSILVRFCELISTIKFYESPVNCNKFASCSDSKGISFNSGIQDIINDKAIMEAIISTCPENIETIIRTYENYSQMSDLFNIFNSMNPDNPETDHKKNNDNSDNNSGNDSNNPDSNKTVNNINPSMMNNLSNIMNLLSGNNMMNNKQQQLYDEYIKELDKIDFTG